MVDVIVVVLVVAIVIIVLVVAVAVTVLVEIDNIAIITNSSRSRGGEKYINQVILSSKS